MEGGRCGLRIWACVYVCVCVYACVCSLAVRFRLDSSLGLCPGRALMVK